MSKMERLKIKEQVDAWSIYEFDMMTLDEMVSKVEKFREDLGGDVVVEIQEDYDDNLEYRLYRWRDETDAEYQKRVDRYNRSKATEKKKREERERKEYERLRKKFEEQ